MIMHSQINLRLACQYAFDDCLSLMSFKSSHLQTCRFRLFPRRRARADVSGAIHPVFDEVVDDAWIGQRR
ncbi:hypothetical protein, partial [Paracoccus thiocyanatus]|uniref:hypothetical protein n=1 Tax=Paracoccus thiocyanatus TaxID=34006 RepID=UPI001C6E09E8